MAHHAYFVTGEIEEGVANAEAFAETKLGLTVQGNPDVMTLRHGLLSVDDARKLRLLAELSPSVGERKVLIISASRLFHEAQNALLKLFEEPPAGTLLILVIPAEGMLLPTLRSRLLLLPYAHTFSAIALSSGKASGKATPETQSAVHIREYLAASPAEREKIILKLIDRTKSDKDEEKQSARLAAIQLIEGLTVSMYSAWLAAEAKDKKDMQAFLEDLHAFLPILHERSAPLKLIFEHISLTIPAAM